MGFYAVYPSGSFISYGNILLEVVSAYLGKIDARH